MTKSDTGLSELQDSLLSMNAIGVFVSKTIKNFPMTHDKRYDELKFLLSNLLLLQICNFMEEYKFLGWQLKKSGKIEILRVLEPLYQPIKENSDIRELRNKGIAHIGHRDKEGRPSYAFQIIVEKKLPQHYAETLFLSYCVVFFVQHLRKYLKEEVTDAENKYRSYIQQFDEEGQRQAQKEIKSAREIKDRLKVLLDEVDARESKMIV